MVSKVSEQVTLKSTFDNIKADASRYPVWLTSPGFWVTLSYRVRRLRKYGALQYMLLLPIDVLLGVVRAVISDTIIPSSMPVGPGLYLPHANGIVLNSESIVGSNVAIFQQVTLGAWHMGEPEICDGTALYAGSKVLGGITVGKNCKIGANAVVTIDVPDNHSVSIGKPVLKPRTQHVDP